MDSWRGLLEWLGLPLMNSTGVLSVLLAVLAGVFALGQTQLGARFFRIVPALLFCYFVPTLLTTIGVLPRDHALYDWVKGTLLPASLLLLILALDVPAILRLGHKAIIMMLAGTAGVMLGGPIALLVTGPWLPEEAWRGMAALCGSWIGGGANMIALKNAAECSEQLFGVIIIVDVFVANCWMAVLLYFAGAKDRIDRWMGADNSAISELQERISAYQKRTQRIASAYDYFLILLVGFGGSWIALELAKLLPDIGDFVTEIGWRYILVTTFGVILSFTAARRLDGAGASRIGGVFIYLLVACIGAHADFTGLNRENLPLIAMGLVWMLVHVTVLLTTARIIRAPIFFVAVGSQANVGGAASAPIVASAFHPSLAAVGALLAVLGYVLGTYCALLMMNVLRAMG